ncbi:hypothetical protein [Mycobacteroides abscessus]|uniref:hypothetical protein n=1 Tax=Mycobacteroides abscessus TaxID=36809 RepID=UPI00266B60BF|nr:hypothetical protein [Mycobacteroides abscessus]MDO3331378.1 hypothetical protein [Mycobacteroides abscessus subsp. abscessus]
MTTPADIKRLLERKEARLTAFLAAEQSIIDADSEFARLQDEHRRKKAKLIEQQRTAYAGLLAAGFTPNELREAGISRRRPPLGATPAKEFERQKSREAAHPPTYDECTMTPHTESSL